MKKNKLVTLSIKNDNLYLSQSGMHDCPWCLQITSFPAEWSLNTSCDIQALMLAVQYGHEDAVLKLLLLGADKSIKSKAGNTAADLARTFKHPQVFDL